MSAWLGPSGNLVEFAHYKGSASVDLDRQVKFTETIGGGRFAQASPTTGLRTWSLSATHMDPSQWAGFDLLTMGAYGDQHRFLEPLSLVTNVISPRKSLPGLAGNTPGVSGDARAGGLVFTEDGLRVPGLLSSGGNAYLNVDAPVQAGTPVTLSIYAQGRPTASLYCRWFDSGGTLISQQWLSSTTTVSGPLKRMSATVTPPSNAVSLIMHTYRASALAAPAVTWTNRLMPWSRGRGCDKAVIHGVTDSTVLAGRFDHQQIADFDFTVTEVGDGA